MKELEILSRGSCFLIPSKSGNNEPKYHVLTASHIVAPWRWPRLYPDEWLKHLNETHTHYTMELRHPDGTFVMQNELLSESFHHATRDMAALHLEEESNAFKLLSSLDFSALELATEEPMPGEELTFHGHTVTGPIAEDGTDERRPVPCDVRGTVTQRSPMQTFATTESLLTDGMCGGPVTRAMQSMLGTPTLRAAGMLEGIVPTDSPAIDHRGLAVFIEAEEIEKFVEEIDMCAVPAERHLQGGHAARHVGESATGKEASDWKKILEDHLD